MGRVPKSTIDEIRRLSREGYLQSEISEKLKVDRATVKKYSVDKARQGNADELALLFEQFFGLLDDLDTFTLLDGEALSGMVNTRTVQTMRKLFKVNSNLAKRLTDPQVDRLKTQGILDLKVLDSELSLSDKRLRSEWEALLKESYPEKLAALVTSL